MSNIIQRILIEATKRRLKNKNTTIPSKAFVKELRTTRVELRHLIQDIFFIFLGIISAAFGLNGFLLPNQFIDGGATGISLILTDLTGLSLGILLIIVNIPFIVMGYSSINKQFAIRSFISIIVLAFTVHFISFPTITDDKLLISVFGGFFLGLGIGLAIRGGSVIDGTEVLAIFLSRRTAMSIGDIILVFNVVIFAFAAYVFSVEIALYAILTYLSASKTVDFVVSGIEEYTGVTIISDHYEEIRRAIVEKLGRGCTLYLGKKGFVRPGESLKDTIIIYTLLTRLEIAGLQTEIDKIDKNAFVIMQSVKDAKGGMIKKRPMK